MQYRDDLLEWDVAAATSLVELQSTTTELNGYITRKYKFKKYELGQKLLSRL